MNKYLKITATILVAYSLLAGLLIPLRTGILSVSPRTAMGGDQLKMTVTAYNADYQAGKGDFQARLRLNPNQAICAKKVEVKNAQVIDLFFEIPLGKLPIQTKTKEGKKSPFPLLEIQHPTGGYLSLESAIYLKDSLLIDGANPSFCAADLYEQTTQLSFPFLNILEETIRNLFYHVPMWFAMMFLMLMSVVYSIRYLNDPQNELHDIKASSLAAIGVLFGFAGITTGALWAKHTWGAYWSFDVKQNTSAVALLIYMAYFVLRSSFDDVDKRAKISAVYNIFAFATLIPLLYIIPRMVDSLHPGMGGNPAFSKLDLDNTMRMVFYPAVLGWILMGWWMADLAARIERVKRKFNSMDN